MGSQGHDEIRARLKSMASVDVNHHPRNGLLIESVEAGDKCHDHEIPHKGPDVLSHASNFFTWHRDRPVKLRLLDEGPLSEVPVSVITVFRNVAKNYPTSVALATEVNGQWKTLTFAEYYDLVIKAAKSLIKLGLQQYQGVGIIGFNSPEWLIANMAAIFAGGLSTGIYATNSPEACRAIAVSAECSVFVVENDLQLKKILSIWPQLPQLKAIIQYKGELEKQIPNVYTWTEFLEIGSDLPDSELDDRISQQSPNHCCTLIYTSGTTGTTKGVMLSHDNLIWTSKMASRSINWGYGCEVLISYLPLSHVAAQIVDIYAPMLYACAVYFARPDALKGSLGETLKSVRPTTFLGVPRVWEKIQEKIMAVGKQNGYVKKWISAWARNIGLRGNLSLMKGESVPYGWTLAYYLLFQTVRRSLGLDRCKYCVVTAAPVKRETLEFFLSLDIPLLEIYGLSECSGPHTFAVDKNCRFASVGKGINGCSTKISSKDDEKSGELCLSGRNIFMGYLDDEHQTKEAFDDDFWLRSGDFGRIDEDNFVFITGRLKELLITAGGENVAPVPIENAVKSELPCVSNCVLIGENRKFLSILLTLKTEVCGETNDPTDILAPSVVEWCRSLGCNAKTVTELIECRDPKIFLALQQGIDRANRRAISHAQNIQKWCILPRDFSLNSGEFGPTMKLKRMVVCKNYQQAIDSLYSE